MPGDGRVDKLERTVFGDGNGTPGLLIRMDRIEQAGLSSKERMAILYGPIVTGLIMAAGEAVFFWLMMGPGVTK